MTATEDKLDMFANTTGEMVSIKLYSEPSEFPAKMVVTSELAAIFKRRGRGMIELKPIEDFEKVTFLPVEDLPVISKRVSPVHRENVKRHLADRHGHSTQFLNGITPEDAMIYHQNIKHENLSHFHAKRD